MRQHRGRRRLAVRAGDGHRPGAARRSTPACRPGAAPGCPPAAAADELDVAGRDGRRGGDGVDTRDVAAVVADVDGDAGGAQPVEHRQLAEVAARHVVAHLGEDEGDGAHARAARRPRRGSGRARGGRAGRRRPGQRLPLTPSASSLGHRRPGRRARPRPRSTRASRPLRWSRPPPGPRRPWPAAPADRLAAGRPRAARRSGVSSRSGTSTAPPASASARALAVWWSSAASGHGTRIDGTPRAASSATVVAPARRHHQVGGGVGRGMRSS